MTCQSCGAPLVDRRPGTLYCDKRCSSREYMRRARARGASYTQHRRRKTTFDLVTGTIVATLRTEDYGRYGAHVRHDPCAYCGVTDPDGNHERDHIVPRARGGANGWDNRTAACPTCNSAKSGRSLLGHMLARHADVERADLVARLDAIRTQLDAYADIGPPVVPAGQRVRHYSPGARRNWRR